MIERAATDKTPQTLGLIHTPTPCFEPRNATMPKACLRMDVGAQADQIRQQFLYPPPVFSVGIGSATERVDIIQIVVRTVPGLHIVSIGGESAQSPRVLTGNSARSDTNRRHYFVFNDLYFPVAGQYTIQFRPGVMNYEPTPEYPHGYLTQLQPIDSVTITVHNDIVTRESVGKFPPLIPSLSPPSTRQTDSQRAPSFLPVGERPAGRPVKKKEKEKENKKTKDKRQNTLC